jgi:hypothetical protein
MKNIPPSSLPNFHGLESEDPDAFLFEFDVLCRSYDYSTTAHKLKLFLATLKGATLDGSWALVGITFELGMR